MKAIKKVLVKLSGKGTTITLGGIRLPINAFLASEVQVRNFLLEGITVTKIDPLTNQDDGTITSSNIEETFKGARIYFVCEDAKSVSFKKIPLGFRLVDEKGIQTSAEETKVAVTVEPSENAEYATGVLTLKKAGLIELTVNYDSGKLTEKKVVEIKPAIKLEFSKKEEEISLPINKDTTLYYTLSEHLPFGSLKLVNEHNEFIEAKLQETSKAIEIKSLAKGKSKLTLSVLGAEEVKDEITINVVGVEEHKVYKVTGINHFKLNETEIPKDEENKETSGIIRLNVSEDLFEEPEKCDITLESSDTGVADIVKGNITKAGKNILEVAFTGTLKQAGELKITVAGSVVRKGKVTTDKKFITKED